MFEERIAHFHETREKFDARVKQLENEKADIEAKIAKAKEMYEIALIDDIDDGNRKTQAEISKHLRQAERPSGTGSTSSQKTLPSFRRY